MRRVKIAGLGALAGALIGFAILVVRFYLQATIAEPPVSFRFIETVWKPVWETKTKADGREYTIMRYVPEQRESSQGFLIRPWNELAGNLGRTGRLDQVMTLVKTANDELIRANLITSAVSDLEGFVHLQVQNAWDTGNPPKLSDQEVKLKEEQFREYLDRYAHEGSGSFDELSPAEPAPAAPTSDLPAASDEAAPFALTEPVPTAPSEPAPTAPSEPVPAATSEPTTVATDEPAVDADDNTDNVHNAEFRIDVAENYFRYLDGLIKQAGQLSPPSLSSRTLATIANSLFERNLNAKGVEVVQMVETAADMPDSTLCALVIISIGIVVGSTSGGT